MGASKIQTDTRTERDRQREMQTDGRIKTEREREQLIGTERLTDGQGWGRGEKKQ